jgi:hypothetical protein
VALALIARAAGVDRIVRLSGSSTEHPNVENAHTVGTDFAACVVAALVVTLMHAMSALPSVFTLGPAGVALGACGASCCISLSSRYLRRHLRLRGLA